MLSQEFPLTPGTIGKPRPPIPQQAAGNLPGEIKKAYNEKEQMQQLYKNIIRWILFLPNFDVTI